MDIITEVSRRHLVSGESISSIARSLKISRPTVRKHLSIEVEPVYNREHQPEPKLGSFKPLLEQWFEVDIKLPKNQRRTTQRLFEGLLDKCYTGAYDSIQRFA
jgi:transposase